MTVKDIVDNLNLFTGCHYITIKLNDYPFFIHSDEIEFDKHLNDEVKEIATCPESYEGPGTVYITI